MEQWVFRGFILVLAVQLLGAVLVYFDAHRKNLKEPVIYMSVVLTPVIGLVVFVAYMYDRENFPRWPEDDTSTQSENRTQMKTEIAYFLGLIALFAIIGLVRSVYLS